MSEEAILGGPDDAMHLNLRWGPSNETPLLTAWRPVKDHAGCFIRSDPVGASWRLPRDELDRLIAKLCEARDRAYGVDAIVYKTPPVIRHGATPAPIDWSRVPIEELAARDPAGFERAVRRIAARNDLRSFSR